MGDAKSIGDPNVKALAAHISSFQFQRRFEEFFLRNALKFTDEVEHQLGYMTTYLEFQEMFNEQMEDFLKAQSLSEDEFAAICKKAIAQDKRADNFLQIVIASMDYDAFFDLMKHMRARAAAETKPRKLSGDEDDKDAACKEGDGDADTGDGDAAETKRVADEEDDDCKASKDAK